MATLRISLWIPNTVIALATVLAGGAIAAAIGNRTMIAVIVGSIGGAGVVVGVGWFLVVQSQRRLIKDHLGAFLEGGGELVSLCHNESVPSPDAQADEWANKVETFLRKYMGESYIPRFQSGAGLPSGYTTLSSRNHRLLAGGLNTRLARLHEFLQELGT